MFSSEEFVFDSEEDFLARLPAGQPLGKAASLLWDGPGPWQLTRPWATVQEPPLFFAAAVHPSALHLLADFDGNGTADILGSPMDFHNGYYGLALWRLDASGGWTRDSLLDWKVRPSHAATASDLNGDGLLDAALVARNLTVGSALVVLLGQRNGVPILEGHYALPGEGSQVLASDVNGDGDTDLVVLGKSPASNNGGVFVLINQGTPATAVASEAATPTAFTLRCQLSQPVQSRHDHSLGRARWSQECDLNHLQHPRTADAPSVDGAAARWRARADMGWPRRPRPTRRHWSLCVSVAGGRADAHPQNG